jgi:hypothetical protein
VEEVAGDRKLERGAAFFFEAFFFVRGRENFARGGVLRMGSVEVLRPAKGAGLRMTGFAGERRGYEVRKREGEGERPASEGGPYGDCGQSLCSLLMAYG